MAHPLGQLSARFTGQLVHPNDPDFDDLRRVHNGLVDRRPALIARCRSAQDVAEIVKFARRRRPRDRRARRRPQRRRHAPPAIGGVVIDLSLMSGVVVDAGSRLARVQGGATWRDFNAATEAHHLAATGGVVSSTGVAGSDARRRPRVADGRLRARRRQRAVDAGRHRQRARGERQRRRVADLFWALRGGGGNFGVVTSFEFGAAPDRSQGHRRPGRASLSRPRRRAAALSRRHRRRADALTAFAGLVHSPDGAARAGGVAGVSLRTAGRRRAGDAAAEDVRHAGPRRASGPSTTRSSTRCSTPATPAAR